MIGAMDDARRARQQLLEGIVAEIREERGVPAAAVRAECAEVLERCLFDHAAALAVLRGEELLEDDPWARCPVCECDTYFRMPVALGRAEDEQQQPVTAFVCEACQYTELRARATVRGGLWWTAGTRHRARPAEATPPYRDAYAASDEAPAASDQAAAAPPAEVSPEWDRRRVCLDGTCIGVVGADDRCRVCGRSAEAA